MRFCACTASLRPAPGWRDGDDVDDGLGEGSCVLRAAATAVEIETRDGAVEKVSCG